MEPRTTDNENLERLTGLVPEAWFDLIGRVVPGAFILITTADNDAIWEAKISNFAIGIVLSYAIGLTLDAAWPRFVESCFDSVAGFAVCSRKFTNTESLWKKIDTLPPRTRGLLVKIMAECVLFRSLFTFAIIQLIVGAAQPCCPRISAWMESWQFRVFPVVLSLMMIAITFASWLKLSMVARSRFENLRKNAPSDSESRR